MIGLLWLLAGCVRHPQEAPALARSSRPAAGTIVGITTRAGAPAEAIDAAFAAIEEGEADLSEWRPGSRTSRLARGESLLFTGPALELFQAGDAARIASGGAFDLCWKGGALVVDADRVTAQDCSGLDLGALLKGWLADRAGDALLAAGIEDFVVDAGGDLVAHGSRGDGAPGWPVSVAVAGRTWDTRLVNEALSSASEDQQPGHIVDARLRGSPAPKRSLAGVVARAPRGLLADTWDTAVYAYGGALPLPAGVKVVLVPAAPR